MPNWKEVYEELLKRQSTPHHQNGKNVLDEMRAEYIKALSDITGRNTIAYYSGWLHGKGADKVSINDRDKNAFMLNVTNIDKTKGLDLILHTPGGNLAATESIVDYLFSMFGNDIRVIIPQISMSAGTMIALASKEIIMGKQSNLGPIDPQIGNVPCQGVLSEFKQATEDIKANPSSAPLWQVIISKYHPTFLGSCQKAIDWSEKLAEEWLTKNMCMGDPDRAKKILKEFSDHDANKSHARHISKDRCKEFGLSIIDMEDDQSLQDAILTVHHAYMLTFQVSTAAKLVENHLGSSYVEADKIPQQVPGQQVRNNGQNQSLFQEVPPM